MDRKKYIVEASDDVKKVIAVGVTRGGAIWTDTTDIENLEELNSDYINEHFSDLQDTAYQKGFEDGKAQREHDDKIEVGDVVKSNRGWMAVVTQIDDDGLSLMDSSGAVASYSDTSKFSKTGRHFDIENILEEMKE